MFKLAITGIPKVDKKLRELEPKIAKKVLRKGMRAGLKIMLARARALAPVGQSRQVLAGSGGTPTQHAKGTLKKAIKIKASRSRRGIRLAILVSRQSFQNDPFYGAFVNEGTKRIKAQKFLEIAFKQTANEVRDVSIAKIMQGIDEVART